MDWHGTVFVTIKIEEAFKINQRKGGKWVKKKVQNFVAIVRDASTYLRVLSEAQAFQRALSDHDLARTCPSARVGVSKLIYAVCSRSRDAIGSVSVSCARCQNCGTLS
ncbi:hypothetical protein RRG08_000577 [Elysia crispata]|uniref:Uncharacterized protein n=1 Tax=Elysia crispata TaxID=231223 RepID=A0AAE0Y895_9GAST|nr:hypothetical protein RRG08_000577 [Elysia crispata]